MLPLLGIILRHCKCHRPRGKIESSGNAASCTCTRFPCGLRPIQWPSWPSAEPLPVLTRQSDHYGTAAACKLHQHHRSRLVRGSSPACMLCGMVAWSVWEPPRALAGSMTWSGEPEVIPRTPRFSADISSRHALETIRAPRARCAAGRGTFAYICGTRWFVHV